MLDTGLTLPATFMNKELVGTIWKAKHPLVMTTNAGTRLLESQAEVIGFGKAWFDEEQMANIVCFAVLVNYYRVVYDSVLEFNREKCYLRTKL